MSNEQAASAALLPQLMLYRCIWDIYSSHSVTGSSMQLLLQRAQSGDHCSVGPAAGTFWLNMSDRCDLSNKQECCTRNTCLSKQTQGHNAILSCSATAQEVILQQFVCRDCGPVLSFRVQKAPKKSCCTTVLVSFWNELLQYVQGAWHSMTSLKVFHLQHALHLCSSWKCVLARCDRQILVYRLSAS